MSVYQRLIDSKPSNTSHQQQQQIQLHEISTDSQHRLYATHHADIIYPLQNFLHNQQQKQQQQATSINNKMTSQKSTSMAALGNTKVKTANLIHCQQVRTPLTKQQFKKLDACESLRKIQQLAMKASGAANAAFFKEDDPVLLKWLQNMRLETELECLAPLQAKSLARDENASRALSVRNSQVVIQNLRQESEYLLEYIDHLIECLPVTQYTLESFVIEFGQLYAKIFESTARYASTLSISTAAVAVSDFIMSTPAKQYPNSTSYQQVNVSPRRNNNCLTIVDTTPMKKLAASSAAGSAKTAKLIDDLIANMRQICIKVHKNLIAFSYDECKIDSTSIEVMLRKLMENYGKFIEISIRTECANIVRALDFDFAQYKRNSMSNLYGTLSSTNSNSSLRQIQTFESSVNQLSLKWALIALWQLTKDDPYVCQTLTEKWLKTSCVDPVADAANKLASGEKVKRRLDYSTKYDNIGEEDSYAVDHQHNHSTNTRSLHQRNTRHGCNAFPPNLLPYLKANEIDRYNDENACSPQTGALKTAISRTIHNSKASHSVTTVELLINILINQPNKHERIDMANFLAKSNNLVDVEELDQSIHAAIYTSNQYKVATLRILNHLCVNDIAVRTILKCLSTPPPSTNIKKTDRGDLNVIVENVQRPENKIIRSIFEGFQRQTSSEHLYENEQTLFTLKARGLKRQAQVDDYDSDYDSARQTSSRLTNYEDSESCNDSSDDVVIKEAIRLLVQLTIPFHAGNQGHDYYSLIGQYSIETLVKYLTQIVKISSNRETVFLSLSALANISFITTEPMKLHGTNRIILEMLRKSPSRQRDLELRDQTVTILANTANKNVLDIISNGGLTFLLSCLESCPTKMAKYKPNKRITDSCSDTDSVYQQINIGNRPRDRRPITCNDDDIVEIDCSCDQRNVSMNMNHTECVSKMTAAEHACMERIRQKTAIAFARLSSDAGTTRMILKYGGVKQLIDLCKYSQKRNHSSSVLLACIMSLRKMSKVVDRETFRYYNALDLIDLEVDQAMEIYSLPQAIQPKTCISSEV